MIYCIHFDILFTSSSQNTFTGGHTPEGAFSPLELAPKRFV